MANISLIADTSNKPTISFTRDLESNPPTLEIKADSQNIVKNIIPSSNSAPPDSAYMMLFNKMIRSGIKEIDDLSNTDASDITCRMYIKYEE